MSTGMNRILLPFVVSASVIVSARADAQPVTGEEGAKNLYQLGQAAFRESRFEDGCRMILRAHWRLPNNKNMGRHAINCSKKNAELSEGSGDIGAACNWYDVIAAEGPAFGEPDEALAASRRRQALLPTVATLRLIGAAKSDATVTVDGQTVAINPNKLEYHVTPGVHSIRVDLPNAPSIVREETFIAGRIVDLDTSLARSDSSGPVSDRDGLALWPFLVGGGGLVLGGIAGGLAASAAISSSEFYDKCPLEGDVPTCTDGTTLTEANDLADSIRARNGAAIGLGAAGGVLVVIGIVGLATDLSSRSPAKKTTGVLVTPTLSFDTFGLLVSGVLQ